MKRNKSDLSLDDVDIRPIDMPHHRTELRRALLASPYWHKPEQVVSKGEKIMQKKTLIAAVLAVAVTAIVLVFGVVVMPSLTGTAYAAELAQKSYQTVKDLPPEQQGDLVKKLQIGNIDELLQRAKNAKDLKVLTYDQFAAEYPLPRPAPAGEGPDLRSLTFLQFTDTDGTKVALGIDKNNNLPAVVMASHQVPGSFKPAPDAQGTNSISSDSHGASSGFQMVVGGMKVEGSIGPDGTGTFLVNGKKYAAPAGTKFSTTEAPTVKVEGTDVFVDGIKLTPEN